MTRWVYSRHEKWAIGIVYKTKQTKNPKTIPFIQKRNQVYFMWLYTCLILIALSRVAMTIWDTFLNMKKRTICSSAEE